MINLLTRSLAVEITDFLCFIRQNIKEKEISYFSKSAFVQYRKKINPKVFKFLSDSLIQEFYTDNDESVKLWNGFRLLSVDGSQLTLPDTQELRGIYGRTRNQTDSGVVLARISVLYDVLNKFVIDGNLSTVSIGEGPLALKHLEFSKPNDLIIYDRLYPSFDLVYQHFERKINFLMRVKENFSNLTREFCKSDLSSSIVKMYPGKNTAFSEKPYNKDAFREVRLLKIVLSTGEVEILITSLFDSEEYPNSIFKDLYFLRWGIETFYDELKNKVKIEHFSGYSQHCILQDFYAALFVSNLQSLIVGEINDEQAAKSTNNKYQYKVNTNLSYGFLKERIITLFFSDNDMEIIISELKELFRKHTIPIRPNRKFDRDVDKYNKRKKPNLLKNRKNAI